MVPREVNSVLAVTRKLDIEPEVSKIRVTTSNAMIAVHVQQNHKTNVITIQLSVL